MPRRGVGTCRSGADLHRRPAALGLDAARADTRESQPGRGHQRTALPGAGRDLAEPQSCRRHQLSGGRARIAAAELPVAGPGLPGAARACIAAPARRASSTRCRTTFPNIGFLSLILPEAKIIDARRHPLDACLSCYRQLFAKGQAFTYDLTEIGEYYLQYQRMMDHWHEVLPGRVLTVQYEEVVADFETQVAAPARVLRTALGAGLPALLRKRTAGAHAEFRAGAPADLRPVGRPLAPLCAPPRRTDHGDRADPRPLSPLRTGGSGLSRCGFALSSAFTSAVT